MARHRPSRKEINRERKFIRALKNFDEHESFYSEIFRINQRTYYRKIYEIMRRPQQYKTFFTTAAADFARQMTTIIKILFDLNDPLDNFYNFCAFFEFAFTEFIPDYVRQSDEFIDNEEARDPNDYFLYGHYRLMDETNSAIHEDAYDQLETRYWDYFDEVTNAGLALSVQAAIREQVPNDLQNILNMSNMNNIKFGTLIIALYHWRKHCSDREILFGEIPLEARDYLQEANNTISTGIYMPTTYFEFRKVIDEECPNLIQIAIVRKERPIELVTYMPLKDLDAEEQDEDEE